jgi:hypothetical protein
LEGGDDDVGAAAVREERREALEEPREDAAPVRPAVQGEIRPAVGVTLGRSRRQVRWVRQHALEPSQSAPEVGADDFHRQPRVSRRVPNRPERVRVQVGGDDAARSTAGGGERDGARAGADLEDRPATAAAGQVEQELGVLPPGVHVPGGPAACAS